MHSFKVLSHSFHTMFESFDPFPENSYDSWSIGQLQIPRLFWMQKRNWVFETRRSHMVLDLANRLGVIALVHFVNRGSPSQYLLCKTRHCHEGEKTCIKPCLRRRLWKYFCVYFQDNIFYRNYEMNSWLWYPGKTGKLKLC